ncbi:MAG: glycosyltransferase [Lapillicoccus sp.]
MTESRPAADRPAVVAVVPAYQPGENLLDLVTSLAAQVTTVFVVDDGSASETVDAAAERGAQVVRHEDNRGIAAALNAGIRAALASKGTVAILTVDQDSEVQDGFVQVLLDAWERAERAGLRVGLVAPQHVTGLPDQSTGRHRGGVALGRAPIQSGQLVPVATLTQVGEFDEGLFIDGVDADFALRCLDAGLAVIVAEGVTLGHRLGDKHEVRLAGRTVTLTRSAPFRYYYLTRNRIRLVGRHARRHPGWAAGQLVGVVGHLGLVLAFGPDRGDRAREAWRGVREGVRGRTGARPTN